MNKIINKFLNFIDLQKGEEDQNKVLENIISNISFRGSNLWILACAIVIASVGLNVNSTAVIIGAMLISPLMGPIVGAGFGLGMYDFELVKKSIKNLAIATIVSLTVSTLYFYISPFKEVQSELLARTSPNIYDVLIAFFGGLVGVIAVTRVEKGNPIPGVAIATALMPPLCTAGYGLATGNYLFFGGALYLYTINCVFICIATFIIVKFLNYPIVKQIDLKNQKQVRQGITALLIIMIIPSVYFAYRLFDEKKYTQQTEDFIENEFPQKDFTLIYKRTDYNNNPKILELAFLTKKFNSTEIKSLNQKLKEYDLLNTKLLIKQDTFDLKNDILNTINDYKKTGDNKDELIQRLQKKITDFQVNNIKVSNEVLILFPEIKPIAVTQYTNKEKTIPVLLYKSETELNLETKKKLVVWLKQRLEKDSVEVYRNQ
ncbi:COG1808 Predicted membrane protein [Flavobacteriaceae bacterium]